MPVARHSSHPATAGRLSSAGRRPRASDGRIRLRPIEQTTPWSVAGNDLSHSSVFRGREPDQESKLPRRNRAVRCERWPASASSLPRVRKTRRHLSSGIAQGANSKSAGLQRRRAGHPAGWALRRVFTFEIKESKARQDCSREVTSSL